MQNNETGAVWAGGSVLGGSAPPGWNAQDRRTLEVSDSKSSELGYWLGYRLDPLLCWWALKRYNLKRGWNRGRAARKPGN